jgi:hypothetical protein
VTEQEPILTPIETGSTSIREEQPAKKSKPAKKAAKATKKDHLKGVSRTDDEKRLARNAALREWRKKNTDRVKAYMTEWRAKRKGMEPDSATGQVKTAMKGADTATKKATSKKSKKSRKGGKA